MPALQRASRTPSLRRGVNTHSPCELARRATQRIKSPWKPGNRCRVSILDGASGLTRLVPEDRHMAKSRKDENRRKASKATPAGRSTRAGTAAKPEAQASHAAPVAMARAKPTTAKGATPAKRAATAKAGARAASSTKKTTVERAATPKRQRSGSSVGASAPEVAHADKAVPSSNTPQAPSGVARMGEVITTLGNAALAVTAAAVADVFGAPQRRGGTEDASPGKDSLVSSQERPSDKSSGS